MGVAELVIIAADSPPHIRHIRHIREAPPPTQPSSLKPWPERDRRLPDRRSLQRGAEEAVIPGTGQGSGRVDPYSRRGTASVNWETNQLVQKISREDFAAARASDLRDLGYGPSGCYLRGGGGRVAGAQRVARDLPSVFGGLYNASNLKLARYSLRSSYSTTTHRVVASASGQNFYLSRVRLGGLMIKSRLTTSEHPATIRQPSGNYQAAIRQLSGSHPATIRQPSGNYQAAIRQLSSSHPATIRQPSGNYQATIRQQSIYHTCRPLSFLG
jgi:hypothetical protein